MKMEDVAIAFCPYSALGVQIEIAPFSPIGMNGALLALRVSTGTFDKAPQIQGCSSRIEEFPDLD
ncbi:hypothetical protein [Oscillatoria sp. FACHB-1406]|uniref:hypothetical protein n=1 Tax=Oscillatoria sp. FACHB-1406 TaxID=2692846 RepID=UPI001686996D|nr:hypothetical protein [Oscillatoria sp. FACHB-1406]MBD2578051.1 hypothetical protein [Oscillatoria sp. FACHB-1406]